MELVYVIGRIINQAMATTNFRRHRILCEHSRLLQAFQLRIISSMAEKV
jgi:hypothetical protein